MKKLSIIITLLLVASISGYSQKFLKLGDNSGSINSSALLDLESTNKGLLLPRVSLTSASDVSTISSPAIGLIVYNLNTASDVTPGLYVFVGGGKWNRLASTAQVQPDWDATSGLSAILHKPILGSAAFSSSSDFATVSHSHSNATISSAGFMSALDKSKLDGFSNFSLPTADATTLGGVKIGSGISIAASGVISVATNYEAPISAGTTAQYWRGDKTWQTLPIYTLSGLGGQPIATNLTSLGGLTNASGVLINNGSGTFSYSNTPTLTGTNFTGIPYTSLTGAPSLSGYLTSTTGVTTLSGGTTGLTPSTATSGAIVLAGTLSAANGGTGVTTVAAEQTRLGLGSNAYTSTSYQPLATNLTSLGGLTNASGVLINNGSGTFSYSNTPTLTGTNFTGIPYTSLTGAPSLSGYLTSTTGVTTLSGGTTGLTPSTATSGAIVLAGTLSLANGGTGSSTQNFVDLTTAQTVAGAKTFSGKTTLAAVTASNISGTTSSIPTGAVGNGAGNTSYATVTISGSNIGGLITVATSNSNPSASSTIASISYNSLTFSNDSYVILTPANALTAALTGTSLPFVSSTSSTGFTLTSGSTALTKNSTYSWYFMIIGN